MVFNRARIALEKPALTERGVLTLSEDDVISDGYSDDLTRFNHLPGDLNIFC